MHRTPCQRAGARCARICRSLRINHHVLHILCLPFVPPSLSVLFKIIQYKKDANGAGMERKEQKTITKIWWRKCRQGKERQSRVSTYIWEKRSTRKFHEKRSGNKREGIKKLLEWWNLELSSLHQVTVLSMALTNAGGGPLFLQKNVDVRPSPPLRHAQGQPTSFVSLDPRTPVALLHLLHPLLKHDHLPIPEPVHPHEVAAH